MGMAQGLHPTQRGRSTSPLPWHATKVGTVQPDPPWSHPKPLTSSITIPHHTNKPFLPYPDNTDQIISSPSSADANLPPSHTQTPLWKSIFSSLSCSGQLCLNLDALHTFSTVGNKEEIRCFCYLAPSCLT